MTRLSASYPSFPGNMIAGSMEWLEWLREQLLSGAPVNGPVVNGPVVNGLVVSGAPLNSPVVYTTPVANTVSPCVAVLPQQPGQYLGIRPSARSENTRSGDKQPAGATTEAGKSAPQLAPQQALPAGKHYWSGSAGDDTVVIRDGGEYNGLRGDDHYLVKSSFSGSAVLRDYGGANHVYMDAGDSIAAITAGPNLFGVMATALVTLKSGGQVTVHTPGLFKWHATPDAAGQDWTAFSGSNLNSPPVLAKTGSQSLTITENSTTSSAETGWVFSTTDPDGDVVTLTVDDNRFEIDSSGKLKVKAGQVFNYEVDNGKTLTMTATDNGTGNLTDTETVSLAVGNVNEAGTIAATNGTLRVGSVLTAGAITDPDGTASSITWQWQRADTADGSYSIISGANSSSYTLQQADAGKFLNIVATYTAGGFAGSSVTAQATGPVANADDVAPVMSAIAGTASFAEQSFASDTDTGLTFTASDADSTLTADSFSITGDASNRFKVVADSGVTNGWKIQVKSGSVFDYETVADRSITLSVTASDGTLTSATRTALVMINNANEAGTIGAISGILRAGKTLTAGEISDPDGTVSDIEWQWQRADTADGTYSTVSNATGSTYILQAADIGKFLKVVATYTAGGYSNSSVTSTATTSAIASTKPYDLQLRAQVTESEELIKDAVLGAKRHVADISFSDDGHGEIKISLGGPDASLFEVEMTGAESAKLYIRKGARLDFESRLDGNGDFRSFDLYVILDGTGEGEVEARHFQHRLTDRNETPSQLILAQQIESLPEGATSQKIADIRFTDDALGKNSVELGSGEGKRYFEIKDDNALWLRSGELNYEAATVVTANLIFSGSGEGVSPAPVSLSLTVEDVDEWAPLFKDEKNNYIIKAPIVSMDENTTLAYTAHAVDSDGTNNIVRYSLKSGLKDDAALFDLNAETGVLRFKKAPDAEDPRHTDIYKTTIVASSGPQDALKSSELALTVRVENVDEAPVIAGGIPNFSVTDTAAIADLPSLLDNLVVTDPEGAQLTWRLLDSAGNPVTWLSVTKDDNNTPLVSGDDAVTLSYTGSKPSGKSRFVLKLEASDGSNKVTTPFVLFIGETLSGTGGEDILIGGPADDLLQGYGGNDQLDGRAGIDTASWGDKTGPVTISLEDDTRWRKTGDGWIPHNTAASHKYYRAWIDTDNNGIKNDNDEYDFLIGIENLIGGSAADSLTGDSGANVLQGGGGADVLDGRAGVDTASYAGSTGAVTIDLSATKDGDGYITPSGGDAAGDKLKNIENLTGGSAGDRLTGDAGVNILKGGAGADTLDGGGGNDRLEGGQGNDILRFTGTDFGRDSVSGFASGDSLVITGYSKNQLRIRWLHPALLSGTSYSISLLIEAGDAAAILLTDFVSGSKSAVEALMPSITFTDSSNTAQTVNLPKLRLGTKTSFQPLVGSDDDEALYLFNDADNTSIHGGAGDDWLYGTDAVNTLAGGSGADRIYGFAGADDLLGGRGDDLLFGGAGADALHGNEDDDTLDGGAGDDKLYGNAGDDLLKGGAGNDELYGHAGDDLLMGGPGHDLLDGGKGRDTASYADAGAGVLVDLGRELQPGGSGAKQNIFQAKGKYIVANYQEGRWVTETYGKASRPVETDTLMVLGKLKPDGSGFDLSVGTPASRAGLHIEDQVWGWVILNAHTQLSNGEAAADRLKEIENLTGSAYDDILTGDSRANTLIGGAGDDTLTGGTGDILNGGGDAPDTLTGGAGDDIFVLEINSLVRDAVTDFTSGDKIRVDTTAGNETTLAALKSALNIDWTNNTNETTTASNDAATNDTVLYHLGADNTLNTATDTVLMVLEDYTTALVIGDFEII